MEIRGKEAHMILVALVGFSAALQDDWFPRYDPFGDVAGLHSQEVFDGRIEDRRGPDQ